MRIITCNMDSSCILSTDGTHVVLHQKPGLDGEVYYNRKSRYSMNVLLTFDNSRLIRYVVTGWPGSVHDSAIWDSTTVQKHPDEYFSPGQYQFGDSRFRLTRYMIVPYLQPAASVPDNREFNTRLSSGRVVSEHGNGVLKARWQSLRGLPVVINEPIHVRKACSWILACSILHNIVTNLHLPSDDLGEELIEDIMHAERSEQEDLGGQIVNVSAAE